MFSYHLWEHKLKGPLLAIIIPGHPWGHLDDSKLIGVILRTNIGLSIHPLCLDLAGHPSYATIVTVSYMGLRHGDSSGELWWQHFLVSGEVVSLRSLSYYSYGTKFDTYWRVTNEVMYEFLTVTVTHVAPLHFSIIIWMWRGKSRSFVNWSNAPLTPRGELSKPSPNDVTWKVSQIDGSLPTPFFPWWRDVEVNVKATVSSLCHCSSLTSCTSHLLFALPPWWNEQLLSIFNIINIWNYHYTWIKK